MLTPFTAGIPTMSAAGASLQMATYPGAGKQSYYPFPVPPAALSSTYMATYGGGGGCGGGSMALTHAVNTNFSDAMLGLGYSEINGGHNSEDIISPSKHHEQTLDNQLSSPPPPPTAIEENHHHRPRSIGSVHETSLSPPLPTAATSPPTQLLSPNSTHQFPLATTSALSSSSQPLQHKPTFNLSTVANSLSTMTNGFPRLTQHHFPQSTFSHIPSTLNSFTPPYTSFSPAAHHPTLPNVVMYQQPPPLPDYSSGAATFNGLWNQYPSNIHTPKLSYDSPRYKLTPERATPLQKWFDEHKDHPYPTRHDKIVLCQDTNLTFTQVSTWFANCRRRMKKASQEDEERPNCTTTSSAGGHLTNGTSSSGRGSSSSSYHDDESHHAQKLRSQSPQDDSPCSSGHHDSEEKIHNYGEVSGLPERFSPLPFDRNRPKQGGTTVSHH